jgi:uncharacterized peroxidase-related enzyme
MTHHGGSLRALTGDETLVVALKTDLRHAELSAADRAMLDYAEKLTFEPWIVGAADIAGLRAHGFSERAVLDIVLAASYFNMINRIADGLGVPLEDDWHAQWESQQGSAPSPLQDG